MREAWSTAGARSAPFQEHPCPCRSEHAPSVPWTHQHHIWPLYAGGPDTPENTVYICPATHDWVHVILRVFGNQGLCIRKREWPYFAYELAVRGWEKMSKAQQI
jgi:hypothetical protein